ncbi:hypothetical protein EBU24_03925 [bacterium]|nr:hypothetical protein [bacterium]
MNKKLIFIILLTYAFKSIYSAEQEKEYNLLNSLSINDTEENLLKFSLAQKYYHQRVCIKVFSPNKHLIDQYEEIEIIKNAQLINKKFLIAMSDYKVTVHDIETDDYIFSINKEDLCHENTILDAQLNFQATFLMTLSNDAVVIHNIKIGSIEYEYKSNKKENIQYAQLSNNGTLLMIKLENKIILYTIQNKLQYCLNQDNTSEAKLSNDEEFLIVLSKRKVFLYRTNDISLDLVIDRENHTIDIAKSLSDITLSDDDSHDTTQIKRKKYNNNYDFYQLNNDKTILATSLNNKIVIQNTQTNSTLFSLDKDDNLTLNKLSDDCDIEINDRTKTISIYKKNFTQEIAENLNLFQINQALDAQQKKQPYPFIEMYCDKQTMALKPQFIAIEDKENSLNTIKRKKHNEN